MHQMKNLQKWAIAAVTILALFLAFHVSDAGSSGTATDSSCTPALPGGDDTEGFGIKSVAFSPDGKFIVAGGAGEAAFLWDAQTGTLLHCFVGHRRTVGHVEFSPDEKTVLT